jgi:hypothetical protein
MWWPVVSDRWPVSGAEQASDPSMDLRDCVVAILNDPALDGAEDTGTKAEHIELLIAEHGWDALLACLCGLLHAGDAATDWLAIADVFWGAVLDQRPMPADAVIALLYGRFERAGMHDEHSENLLWSITNRLKGVGYLSDYEPLRDPGVISELNAFWPQGYESLKDKG